MRNNFEFRGTWADLFGTILLVTLLTVITCGIYLPWGYVQMRRVVLNQTFFQDRPLKFDGTGGQVFGQFLIIIFLTLITLGFYFILGFAQVRMLKWDTEHTILPDGRRLEYRGTALGIFIEQLILALLSSLTLGIYFFWGYARFRSHVIGNTYVHGHGTALQFTGTGGQFFGIAIVNFLLTLITLGFYSLLGFASVRTLNWDTQNTILPISGNSFSPETAFQATSRPVNVTVNIAQ